MSLLGACQVAEHRRLGDRGDQAVSRFHSGRGQSQRLDASVAAGARTAYEAPLLEPVDEEGDVRWVAVQAVSELTSGQRGELRIELPEDIGQRDREVELDEGFVEVSLQRCV